MSKESLVIRLLCSEARIDSHKLRTGFSNREDWKKMTDGLGQAVGSAALHRGHAGAEHHADSRQGPAAESGERDSTC